MKIIQINSVSSSYFVKDFERDIYRWTWCSRITHEFKKRYPDLNIECWNIEKTYKKEKQKIVDNIKFRIFPTQVSIRNGMEISFSMLKQLKKEIKKAEKNNEKLIIHLHEYHSFQNLAILCLNKKNTKIIAQHHGGRSPFKHLKKYKRFFTIFPVIMLLQFFENLLLKKINIFYYLSNEEKDYLKNITKKSKLKFQTMGISNEYFENISKKLARKKLKLKQDKKYFLYIGRIKTTKGMKELFSAMTKYPDIDLFLMGEGRDSELYQEYVKQNNLKNIKFLGPIYGKDKFYYLSACDCLILPSYTEGAPVVLMEAMAKNLPIIATNVGGVSKMMENNQGIIINPKSSKEIEKAIKQILKFKQKNIKKYAEQYKWDNIIKQTYEDYTKV